MERCLILNDETMSFEFGTCSGDGRRDLVKSDTYPQGVVSNLIGFLPQELGHLKVFKKEE